MIASLSAFVVSDKRRRRVDGRWTSACAVDFALEADGSLFLEFVNRDKAVQVVVECLLAASTGRPGSRPRIALAWQLFGAGKTYLGFCLLRVMKARASSLAAIRNRFPVLYDRLQTARYVRVDLGAILARETDSTLTLSATIAKQIWSVVFPGQQAPGGCSCVYIEQIVSGDCRNQDHTPALFLHLDELGPLLSSDWSRVAFFTAVEPLVVSKYVFVYFSGKHDTMWHSTGQSPVHVANVPLECLDQQHIIQLLVDTKINGDGLVSRLQIDDLDIFASKLRAFSGGLPRVLESVLQFCLREGLSAAGLTDEVLYGEACAEAVSNSLLGVFTQAERPGLFQYILLRALASKFLIQLDGKVQDTIRMDCVADDLTWGMLCDQMGLYVSPDKHGLYRILVPHCILHKLSRGTMWLAGVGDAVHQLYSAAQLDREYAPMPYLLERMIWIRCGCLMCTADGTTLANECGLLTGSQLQDVVCGTGTQDVGQRLVRLKVVLDKNSTRNHRRAQWDHAFKSLQAGRCGLPQPQSPTADVLCRLESNYLLCFGASIRTTCGSQAGLRNKAVQDTLKCMDMLPHLPSCISNVFHICCLPGLKQRFPGLFATSPHVVVVQADDNTLRGDLGQIQAKLRTRKRRLRVGQECEVGIAVTAYPH